MVRVCVIIAVVEIAVIVSCLSFPCILLSFSFFFITQLFGCRGEERVEESEPGVYVHVVSC